MRRDYQQQDMDQELRGQQRLIEVLQSEDADVVLAGMYMADQRYTSFTLDEWRSLGTQPRVYHLPLTIPQPGRYFYQRFLDLLQVAFPRKPEGFPLTNPLASRSGWMGRNRNTEFLRNVDVLMTALAAYWNIKFQTDQGFQIVDDLQAFLLLDDRIDGREIQIPRLRFFNTLTIGVSIVFNYRPFNPQIQEILLQDKLFTPVYIGLAKWLNMQQNQVYMNIEKLGNVKSITDIKQFLNYVFTLPFGTLSPGDGDFFNIVGIKRITPTIDRTITGFFTVREHVSILPDRFSIDYQNSQSEILQIFCMTTFFPYMIYSLLPWLIRKQGELRGGVRATRTLEFLHLRKNFFREPIISYLTFQEHVVKKYLFKTQNQWGFGASVIESIMEARSDEEITRQLIKYLVFSAKLLSRNLLRTIRNMREDLIQHYTQTDQDEQPVLTVARVHIKGPILPIDVSFMYEQSTSEFSYIFRKMNVAFNKQIRIAGQRFDWTFYARKRLDMKKYIVEQFQGECVQVVNDKLVQLNLPRLDFKDCQNPVDYLSVYCIHHQINLEVVGFREKNLNYKAEWCIRIGPRHIQIYPGAARSPQQRVSNAAASFQKESKTQQMYCYDNSMNLRSTVEDWEIGDQLPLDQQLCQDDQKLFRRRCIVIDIEALSVQNQRQTPYMICVMGYLSDVIDPIYMCFSNTETEIIGGKYSKETIPTNTTIDFQRCINDFSEWLARISHKYTSEDPLYVWGFNSMGYEITYLLPVLTRIFSKVELLGEPSQCRSFSICGGAIIFADILKILPPKKLKDLSREFNVLIQKQGLEIDLMNTWDLIRDNYETIKTYCYYDCVSSLLLLHKVFVGFCEIARKINMPYTIQSLRRKITASGLGWYFFVQGFFQQSIRNNQNGQSKEVFYNQQPREVYQFQRKSYSGGIVQVWRHYYCGRVYVVDINSMYPAMLVHPLPWIYKGQVQMFENRFLLAILAQPQSDLYLYKVISYRLPCDFLGCFVPTKQLPGTNKNTYYNDYQGDDLYLRGIAIKRILHHKGSVCVTRVWRYSSGGIESFKNFAQVFYKMRCEQTKESLKGSYKLLINSVIGRCSMRQQSQCSFTPFPQGQNCYFYDDGNYLNVQDPTLPAVGRLVRLTALITERARCYLDELGQKAGYENLLYCDTDSLIVTQQGYKRLGSPSTKALKLGDFKCQTQKDNSSSYYTEGFFKNRKDYLLKYLSKTGQICFLHKAKGIPKKYITKEYSKEMAEAIKVFSQMRSVNLPVDYHYPIGPPIQIKVWNRQFKNGGGVTIKSMTKTSNLITDRVFYQPHGIGVPRSPNSFMNLMD